jgi:hypothetical protein
VPVSAAPRAGLEVVLQVRVAAGGGRDRRERLRRKRRAAEVGVDDDSRGVDHRPQARPGTPRSSVGCLRGQVRRIGAASLAGEQ